LESRRSLNTGLMLPILCFLISKRFVMSDVNGSMLEEVGFAEIEEAFGVDLSSSTPPDLASLEEAQTLIETLWSAS